MATGTLASTAPPEKLAGFLVQAQARVRLGLQPLFAALETTSASYTNYSASLGILDAQALDVGKVSAIGVNVAATVEPYDAANERIPSIYYVSGETAEITLGATQFDPAFLRMLLHHAVQYDIAGGLESLITFGTLCNILSQPLEIGVTNLACFLPAGQDIALGLTAFIMTFYDVIATSGLNYGAMTAKNLNNLDTTFMGRPVESLANGNQTGSIYAF